jgi:hypothetical protein
MGSKMGSKQQVVKIGPLEYEPEVLTSITESSFIQASVDAIIEYADTNFNRLPGDESGTLKYSPETIKGKKEYRLFNSCVDKITVILASDKHGVFESVQQLFDLARADKEGFEKLYQAAIKANPTFKPVPVEAPKEGEPNPLG